MEPSEYLALLRKHWLMIAVVSVLGFVGAYGYSKTLPPSYRATASVIVSLPQGTTPNELGQGLSYAQGIVQNYSLLATQPLVLDPVIERLQLDMSPQSLRKAITVENPLNTTVLQISAVAGDPRRAADIANGVADQLPRTIRSLNGATSKESPAVQVKLLGAAVPPGFAFSPNTQLNAATGLALGLMVGVGFVLARSVIDTRVRSLKDLRRVTDAAVLSLIRFERQEVADRLVVRDKPQSDRAEAFRRLRTNLRFLNLRGSSRALVVTSSLPTEGKSVTTINLAIAMAEGSGRILLVDADLRRPSIARYLGLEGSVGLTTILIGDAHLDDVVQPWGDGNLDVLTSGQIPPNPSELLDSPAMTELLALAATRYDVVLLDSAPLLPVTDAAVLARVTDGALVVVGCRTVHRHQLADGLGALAAVDARVLGLVLNQVSAKETGIAYVYGSASQATTVARPWWRRWIHARRTATAPSPVTAPPVVVHTPALDPPTPPMRQLFAPTDNPGGAAPRRLPEFLRGLDVPPPPTSLSIAVSHLGHPTAPRTPAPARGTSASQPTPTAVPVRASDVVRDGV